MQGWLYDHIPAWVTDNYEAILTLTILAWIALVVLWLLS